MPTHSLADETLAQLAAGNRRFASNQPTHPHAGRERRVEVAHGQKPIAMILGCADSRVPPELVFDCGLGDLFVVRTAGHVLDAAVLGSLEYGVGELRVPVLVVLGHEQCGAVNAALEAIAHNAKLPGAIGRLVETILPAVISSRGAPGDWLENAVRANVECAMQGLRRSEVLSTAIRAGELLVVGARYRLGTGMVEWLGDREGRIAVNADP
jgi:carbonic anhydrase